MKILVTGANGYLGKGVVKQLINNGHDVVATDLYNTNIDKRARIKCVDLFSVDDPYEYFEKPEILLHMAWRDGFVHNSTSHINDLSKHYIFLKKIMETEIKQIAIIGSMHEIGFYEGSINEHTPTNPQSLYGVSKDALRRIMEIEMRDKDIVFQWLRGFYIVGNTEDGCSVFSKIVQAERKNQIFFPFTEGLNQFDFLDYDIFCERVVETVEQTEINGIINICSGRPEKLSDRVERFINDNHFKIKLKYGEFPDRPYDSKAIWGDDFKIEMIHKLRNSN